MKGRNPFDISFGKVPIAEIARLSLKNDILKTFMAEETTQQVYMITGVRGSGKTVLMSDIANTLEQMEDWIVVRLNPERDLLQSLGAKLCSIHTCAEMFKKAKLNFSLFGFGIEVSGSPQISDIESAIESMLKSIQSHGKKVLITIDEVTNNQYLKIFAGTFQIYVGQKLPIFLLMTGLYENIEELQNERNLTFLYRAPKLQMTSLNTAAIEHKYQSVFGIESEKARKMAELTSGYPFAFQALGYVCWNRSIETDEGNALSDAVIAEYRQYLEEYVYEKIWSELSKKDKKITYGIARSKDGKISSVNEILELKEYEINQYRKRLLRKGIICANGYGYLKFTLPLFDQFVLSNYIPDM